MNSRIRKLALAVAVVASMGLAGCATGPYGNNGGYNNGTRSQGYQQGTTYQQGPRDRRNRRNCNQCGVVQDVQQVYLRGSNNSNGGTLGAIIGAVAGGVLGHTVGKGDGRTAATVAGAVAGGAVGHHVGERSGNGEDTAWQIQVRLDDGRYATVTQREDPNVRAGDYVQVRDNHVYAY